VKAVLQDPHTLLQMFCLNYDFGDGWYMFGSAASDATRQMTLAVGPDQFPYWVKRLGINDAITATFAAIDWSKNKLTLAPAVLPFSGDAVAGWTLTIDNTSPVFPFLKAHRTGKVYMAVTYAMAT
jgi:hypothetical protein